MQINNNVRSVKCDDRENTNCRNKCNPLLNCICVFGLLIRKGNVTDVR